MITDSTVRLGNLIDFSNGRSSPERNDNGPFAVFGSNGIIGRAEKTNAIGPTIIIGRVGTYCGSLHYSRTPCWVTDNAIRAVARGENDTLYLFHLLSTLRLNDRRAGSGQPLLNQQILSNIPVFAPSPAEQRAIAAVLSALDDKIELNRRMNETLEASARALFRDWFVDFGPTRAKAEGRPAYLAPDLWSLFPDRLGDDGVPNNWQAGTLADLVIISPKEPLKSGCVAPYLDMAALPTRGAITKLPIERLYSSGTRFRNGDTLLARITPCLENGKTGYVQNLPDDTVGWGSTEFIVLRAKSPIPSAVSYLIARDDEFRRHAIQSMTGTSGRQRANADAVARYPAVVSDDPKLWQMLAMILDSMFKQIASNERESRTLAETRDMLLPKLMSGEILIRDAEALAA